MADNVFSLYIQPDQIPTGRDAAKYKKVLLNMLERSKIEVSGAAAPASTLSNCTERETECTCDRDD